ncbi:hypothetical protein G4Y79_15310 [Phototrophicus methaneseepsis]|uniref:Uncharacterized protein n=1 Tax=Phototrophicus methaneseepsis TaxID=2710758 RepID=A0A7S8E634_9CHLR|nr:hypothetical protein [Phototrophicus methaneseepsis]QPC81071.1 hypothetical protein G4Y79_15310 [Phototrophicus methaneseepsis]
MTTATKNGAVTDKSDSADKKPLVDGLKFDFTKATARDIETVLNSVETLDISAVSDLMAKLAVEGPLSWGDMNSVDTYKDLLWPDFQAARRTLYKAFEDHVKN